ncbi:MAG: radical SAM protein, partial [Myxococcota bacterium]|nr:radical SAM protein [Myxococcota bacterium]
MGVHINLELTDHCNIRCRMCSQSLRDEAHGVPMRFMSWETWQASLQGLEGMPDEVHLCPHWLGEPTIHPEFDRFVEHAFTVNHDNRLFRTFKLHTNAVVFGEARARLLVELANRAQQEPDTFGSIHFSIDAHSPRTYDVVKGADRGAQVYENVERFLDVREELGAAFPVATLAFVVQPENAHEAAPFLEHWTRVLERLGRPLATSWEWPGQPMDTVYFRR